MNSGVYSIRNLLNSDLYIGSSQDLRKREISHFSKLRKGEHHSNHLQQAFDKYGNESFVFEILVFCTPSELLGKEQEFINTLNPSYNICKEAGSCRGVTRSSETRRKMGIAKVGNQYSKGLKLTQEIKQKISNTLMGIRRSEESRLLMSIAKKGKPSSFAGKHHSEETRYKIGISSKERPSNRKGVKLSDETKKKISVSKRAQTRKRTNAA